MALLGQRAQAPSLTGFHPASQGCEAGASLRGGDARRQAVSQRFHGVRPSDERSDVWSLYRHFIDFSRFRGPSHAYWPRALAASVNCPLFPTLQRSPTPPRRPCFTRHGRCGPGSGIAESRVPCEPAVAGLLALAPGEGECSRARRRHWTVRLPAPGGVAGSPSLGRACATPTPRLAPAGQPSCEPRPPGPGTGNEGPGRPRARTAHRCLCAQLPWPVPLVQGLVACHSSSAWPQ